MRIKLDENLPYRLVSLLTHLGHDVHTVHQEDLTGKSDLEVWNATQREHRFFITQDLDFSDVQEFAPGTHHGILVVRLRSPHRTALIERTEQLFRRENTASWAGCFVVATEHKLRIRRP